MWGLFVIGLIVQLVTCVFLFLTATKDPATIPMRVSSNFKINCLPLAILVQGVPAKDRQLTSGVEVQVYRCDQRQTDQNKVLSHLWNLPASKNSSLRNLWLLHWKTWPPLPMVRNLYWQEKLQVLHCFCNSVGLLHHLSYCCLHGPRNQPQIQQVWPWDGRVFTFHSSVHLHWSLRLYRHHWLLCLLALGLSLLLAMPQWNYKWKPQGQLWVAWKPFQQRSLW